MMYIVENPMIVLSFFTIPFLGWLLYNIVGFPILSYAALTSFLLFLPAFTDYTYSIDNIYPILLYIVLACGYAFVFKKYRNIIRTLIIPTLLLFVGLGITAFFGVMLGSITVQQRWELNGYRVKYIHDQGFSGGALMRYDLYKYADIPIFIRYVDSKVDNDTTHNCTITFADAHFSFNKCAK